MTFGTCTWSFCFPYLSQYEPNDNKKLFEINNCANGFDSEALVVNEHSMPLIQWFYEFLCAVVETGAPKRNPHRLYPEIECTLSRPPCSEMTLTLTSQP